MIPKIIHYCWFGGKEKPKIVKDCILSWGKYCPDFEIKEWNETNFDVNSKPFTKKMYEEKHWAFVADYVRLDALLNEGGIYLDTDMLLVKSISNLLENDIFLGEESPGIISAGSIGTVKNHKYIYAVKEYYDLNISERITIPKILTEVYNNFKDKDKIKVLPFISFYPYSPIEIKKFNGQKQNENTYGVHLWNYSWGHPLNKFLMKVGIYRLIKKWSELLGIKNILKRIFKIV